jgi:hypothetical protein
MQLRIADCGLRDGRARGSKGESSLALQSVRITHLREDFTADGRRWTRMEGRVSSVFISVHPWFNFCGCGWPRYAFCAFLRQSAIRNPQCRRNHKPLPKLPYLMIPAQKSGFTRLDCGFTGPIFGKSSQPPFHQHLTHKWQPFQ